MGQYDGRSDVVIAGAGIAGLALAVGLGRALRPKFAISICDPALDRDVLADDRVSAITKSARLLLEALGVWRRLADRAQPVHEMKITDSRLENVVRPEFLSFEEDASTGEPLAHIVGHRDIAVSLRDAAAGVGVKFVPAGVDRYEIENDAVSAQVAGRGTIAATLLVAADGARSKLRKNAGISSVAASYEQSGIVATIGHERDHEGIAVQHFLPAGPFAILPLTGRRSSIVWAEKTGEANRIVALPPEEFKKELQSRFGMTLGEIEVLSPARAYPLSISTARSFVGERLALLGDAAHVIHPLAGQGLNLGLRDVGALAECVADAARLGLDHGSPDVLKRYERWRRSDTVVMGTMTDNLNRLFSNDSDALRLVRDVGLGIVARMPALKDYFSREAAGTSGDVPRLLRGEVL